MSVKWATLLKSDWKLQAGPGWIWRGGSPLWGCGGAKATGAATGGNDSGGPRGGVNTAWKNMMLGGD